MLHSPGACCTRRGIRVQLSVRLRLDTVVDKDVAGTKLQNIVPFEIKFATCVHGNEQRVAFSIF